MIKKLIIALLLTVPLLSQASQQQKDCKAAGEKPAVAQTVVYMSALKLPAPAIPVEKRDYVEINM